MLHIALVTYEMNQGGTNRVLCELANGFAAAGHRITLVACTSAGALDSAFRAQLSAEIGYVALSDTAWSSRAWGQIRCFFRFRKWTVANRPDIILATGNNISWFSSLGTVLTEPPKPSLFVKTTNPIVRDRDGPFIGWIRRKVYGRLFRRAHGVMTLSDAETRLLQSQFPMAADKFSTVYNAYVTSRHGSALQAARPSAQAPWTILAAGRLAAQKNFTRLLEAIAMLDRDDVLLLLAGDGEERQMLEGKARDLGISDRVQFLGFRNDVTTLMAQAHVFVLSSDYEGLPAVVVEALATNCPVISTDCFANARELLGDLPGCAICDCTSEALAQTLHNWLDAPHPPYDLMQHAEKYTTPSSVKSHLKTMGLT
jgi:glycosyltransferase involved in cell wall biosynthesis